MEYLSSIENYLGKEITNYQRVSSGWDFEVFLTEGLVFRFPKGEKEVQSLKTEKELLHYLSPKLPVQIPVPKLIDESFFVYPLIPGEPLKDDIGAYTGSIIDQLVACMHILHDMNLDDVPLNDDESEVDPKFVAEMKETLDKRLSKKITKQQLSTIFRYLDELFYDFFGSKRTLIHADLQGDNILTKDGSISGIIDFTNMKIGSVELDFCNFYDIDEQLLQKIVAAYDSSLGDEFYESVFFLARRGVLFEICNEEVFTSKQEELFEKLRRYKFI